MIPGELSARDYATSTASRRAPAPGEWLTGIFKGVHKFMKVTFDPVKRNATLRSRGLDFAEAPRVFAGEHYTKPDLRFDYGEPRFQTVGFLSGRMVMVVWTPRDQTRHIISMRKCNEREQKAYRKQLGED